MIKLHDVTLRDGNHALRHKITPEDVQRYCTIANKSLADVIEVGHGNGLGASSFLVGKAKHSDEELLSAARRALKDKKLGVHVIPGFATFSRDIDLAIEIGVDSFRIAAHVTEADVCEPHIEKLAEKGLEVFGVLMMSHMASVAEFVEQAKKFESYGASGVIFMDSAGTFLPEDVNSRVRALRESFEENFLLGFHAHNNLGLGVANAVAAKEAGATIIDGSSAGLGAGAGNLQLELFVAWLVSRGQVREEELETQLEIAEFVEENFVSMLPRISTQSVRSGMAGAFSGYSPQVKMAASSLSVKTQSIWKEIGARGLVAGQESAIWEIAQDLANL